MANRLSTFLWRTFHLKFLNRDPIVIGRHPPVRIGENCGAAPKPCCATPCEFDHCAAYINADIAGIWGQIPNEKLLNEPGSAAKLDPPLRACRLRGLRAMAADVVAF